MTRMENENDESLTSDDTTTTTTSNCTRLTDPSWTTDSWCSGCGLGSRVCQSESSSSNSNSSSSNFKHSEIDFGNLSPNRRDYSPERSKGMSDSLLTPKNIFRVPRPTFPLLVILVIIINLVTPSLSKLTSELDDSEEGISLHRHVEPQVLQRLESQFLKLFKMERRPAKKRGGTIKVPKYLIDMYESQTGLTLGTSNLNLPGRHTRTANTVRTFYDDNQNHENAPNHSEQFVHFDLSSVPPEEEVTGAELRIPFHIHTPSEVTSTSESGSDPEIVIPKKVRVIVSDVTRKPKKKLKSEPIMYAVDTKVVDLGKKRKSKDTVWLTMDVFPAVGRWLKDSKRNHGLVVQIFDAKTGELISEVSGSTTERHLRLKRSLADGSGSHSESPVLFTYSDDGLHKRKTRDARTLSRHYRNANDNKNKQRNRNKGQRNKGRKRNLCARHKMFVDFTDVGWNDWIVAPPGYHAHHCRGECPFPMADHLNATNHAVIQALVNSMNAQYVPPPCCVPTKYSSLSLLYTDASDKIVLKNYNEMVVDSCGCS